MSSESPVVLEKSTQTEPLNLQEWMDTLVLQLMSDELTEKTVRIFEDKLQSQLQLNEVNVDDLRISQRRVNIAISVLKRQTADLMKQVNRPPRPPPPQPDEEQVKVNTQTKDSRRMKYQKEQPHKHN